DAGELELEDRVEGKDDPVPVDLVVLAGHGLLLYSERNTDPCRAGGRCGAAPWSRGPETESTANTPIPGGPLLDHCPEHHRRHRPAAPHLAEPRRARAIGCRQRQAR